MTVLFCGATLYEVENLKYILQWFELISSLKIKYDKCEMIGKRVETNLFQSLASLFGTTIVFGDS